jgi:hypothetical protein
VYSSGNNIVQLEKTRRNSFTEAKNSISIEEKIKGMNEEKQQEYRQGLVNRDKAFEAKNGITRENGPLNNDALRLQELRDIRENRGKEMDKTEGLVQNGRDDVEDRDSEGDRNNIEDLDKQPDEDTENEDFTNLYGHAQNGDETDG